MDDFKKTPMLVWRDKIREVLIWLKTHDCDYSDLSILDANLNSYAIEGVPVIVEHCLTDSSINPLGMFLSSEEALDDSQKCHFAVHGLTGHIYLNMSIQAFDPPLLSLRCWSY
jgi:hypothetical protein